jgi:ketosteroid isomerase-like protein
LEARVAAISHVRDGRASEAWFFTDDHYENDEFWS